jgi:hypothetical protein
MTGLAILGFLNLFQIMAYMYLLPFIVSVVMIFLQIFKFYNDPNKRVFHLPLNKIAVFACVHALEQFCEYGALLFSAKETLETNST